MTELKKGELLEALDLWWKDEWNIKGGLIRALSLRGKKEKAKEVIAEAELRRQAYQQIREMIQKPGVGEKFLENWTRVIIHTPLGELTYYNLEGLLRQMLKEADVHV